MSRRYKKGEKIFVQGDRSSGMYCVEQGNVKLSRPANGGRKSVVIAILRAGDCFGEECLVGNSIRGCTATSIQQSTVGRIPTDVVQRSIRDLAGFGKLLSSYLVLRIGTGQDDVASLLIHSSEQRLARLLLRLSDFGRDSLEPSTSANIDQGTLAQSVGTTRSRVSHFMSEFRKKGYIDYNGDLHVRNALLRFLANKR
jgi:CRP-like cAMP-binding protein